MSTSTRAFGFCDRTGFRYDLKNMVEEVVDGKPSGLRVGRDVVDKDHPQLQVGRLLLDDPKPLDNPSPEGAEALASSRVLWAWRPVGIPDPFRCMTGQTGRVTVSTGE